MTESHQHTSHFSISCDFYQYISLRASIINFIIYCSVDKYFSAIGLCVHKQTRTT